MRIVSTTILKKSDLSIRSFEKEVEPGSVVSESSMAGGKGNKLTQKLHK